MKKLNVNSSSLSSRVYRLLRRPPSKQTVRFVSFVRTHKTFQTRLSLAVALLLKLRWRGFAMLLITASSKLKTTS